MSKLPYITTIKVTVFFYNAQHKTILIYVRAAEISVYKYNFKSKCIYLLLIYVAAFHGT